VNRTHRDCHCRRAEEGEVSRRRAAAAAANTVRVLEEKEEEKEETMGIIIE